MLKQMVHNILVYVVMITILKELVSKKEFAEIFRFTAGLILILLCATPFLPLLENGDVLVRQIEEEIFSSDMEQLKQEAALAEGGLEKVLFRECEKRLEEQMGKLAAEQGEQAREVKVTMAEGEEGEMIVKNVALIVAGDAQEVMADDTETIEPVGEIRVRSSGENEGSAGTEGMAGRGSGRAGAEEAVSRRQDAQTRKLKNKICERYELSKKAVKVWRED